MKKIFQHSRLLAFAFLALSVFSIPGVVMAQDQKQPRVLSLELQLINAINDENIAEITSLLDAGANPNVKPKDYFGGNSPICTAVDNGNQNIVALLFDRGANPNKGLSCAINAANDTYNTVDENTAMVKVATVALDKGADPNSIPLYDVNNDDMIALLLDRGADPNVNDTDIDDNGMTPLHIAVDKENKKMIALLLSKGADPRIENIHPSSPYWPFHTTPLHMAAEKGKLEMVAFLIAQGLEVDMRDSGNETPLHYAARGGHKETVVFLLKKGANPNARRDVYNPKLNEMVRGGDTPLHLATMKGHKDIAVLLLDEGVDPNSKGPEGTPLFYATNKAVAELLVNRGADVNAKSMKGTPLHRAADYYQLDIAQFFIAQGAQMNDVLDHKGRTPLHIAAINKNPKMVELLLDAGASVNAQDLDGKTPLHRAVFWFGGDIPERVHDTVAILLERDADMDAQDKDGNTPLHIAAQETLSDSGDIVELLIKKGAAIDTRNHNRKTPLQVAASEHAIQALRNASSNHKISNAN